MKKSWKNGDKVILRGDDDTPDTIHRCSFCDNRVDMTDPESIREVRHFCDTNCFDAEFSKTF